MHCGICPLVQLVKSEASVLHINFVTLFGTKQQVDKVSDFPFETHIGHQSLHRFCVNTGKVACIRISVRIAIKHINQKDEVVTPCYVCVNWIRHLLPRFRLDGCDLALDCLLDGLWHNSDGMPADGNTPRRTAPAPTWTKRKGIHAVLELTAPAYVAMRNRPPDAVRELFSNALVITAGGAEIPSGERLRRLGKIGPIYWR